MQEPRWKQAHILVCLIQIECNWGKLSTLRSHHLLLGTIRPCRGGKGCKYTVSAVQFLAKHCVVADNSTIRIVYVHYLYHSEIQLRRMLTMVSYLGTGILTCAGVNSFRRLWEGQNFNNLQPMCKTLEMASKFRGNFFTVIHRACKYSLPALQPRKLFSFINHINTERSHCTRIPMKQ